METLPVDAVREELLTAIQTAPVVLTAPTGSGKSTRLPLWLAERYPDRRVLVVEPRRVACRALAERVAATLGEAPGGQVGYAVRDERRAGESTRVLFATPGVVLRMLRGGDLWGADGYGALVLDELHERSLELDLILALALRQPPPALAVTSATVAGDRVAEHIGGVHLQAEGRLHPVAIHYAAGGDILPEPRDLEQRVRAAVERAADDPGDVLVFLPGVGEIRACEAALRGLEGLEVLALHGGLSLKAQSRIFRPGRQRRVILATNVAETSLTVPRVGVVIDSGLVRRTRYRDGRGHLTLVPIAADSAAQRAGRAGRLGPGVCYRLWRRDARLEPATPPEIARESLVPLVLAAAACGAPELDLPFLDAPRPFAVAAAREALAELGALDGSGRLTERGRRLAALPLEPQLGRLLIEGERRGTLAATVALAAALSTRRSLLAARPEDPADDLREPGCDATALIRAVWEGQPERHGLSAAALAEARQAAGRIRRALGVEPGPRRLDRRALAETLLAAWPRCAHVARRRKRRVAWSNGGTELSLGRDSAVREREAEALLVLDSRAFGHGTTRELRITAAMPVPLAWIQHLGRERLAGCALERGQLVARIERVYAGRVLAVTERSPEGALAREAARDLFVRGALFKDVLELARTRHRDAGLLARLEGREPLPPFEDWVLARLEVLGLESAADLALLDGVDLLPEPLDEAARERLDKDFPRALATGDARYHITYDVARRRATLHQVFGTRKTPPPEGFLPRLPGWTLIWEHKNRERVIRRR